MALDEWNGNVLRSEAIVTIGLVGVAEIDALGLVVSTLFKRWRYKLIWFCKMDISSCDVYGAVGADCVAADTRGSNQCEVDVNSLRQRDGRVWTMSKSVI